MIAALIRGFRYLCLVAIASSHQALMAQPIDSLATLDIGGIKQVVQLKGKDTRKPILLFLHGGPGNSVMQYAEKFTSHLQDHFVVVQWDQRNAGKTLALNSSPIPLNAELFRTDTKQLIDTLLKRFNHSNLYLAGHSWGTYLGFGIAIRYPELLHAYVAIGPMINQLESERTALELIKEKAIELGNKIAQKELSMVQVPFENGEQLYYHRKWLLDYMGSKAKISKTTVQQWSNTWLAIFNEASQENLFETDKKIHCPVYFFLGRKDLQTNSTIAKNYFDILEAPKKEIVWFERSAHALPTTEPEKMQQVIVERVLE